ncbi:MAG: cation diffusion facilitator family transporter [Acetobacteraceae bacterium]
MSRGEQIAAGSIAVGCVVLALKGAAWWITGSAALYSDALESIVNVAASVIALAALRFAAIPPDANHPYGHDKAEFFAAVIEGALIVIAALSIFRHAWEAWHDPHPIAQPVAGLALNGVATVMNAVWSAVLIRTGRQARSPALLADGRHLLADVVTSIGVAAGGRAGGADRLPGARSAARRGDRRVCAVVGHGDDLDVGRRPDGRRAAARGGAAHPRTGRAECRRRAGGA